MTSSGGAPAREQQMMQRSVRQHDAELAIVGRHISQWLHGRRQDDRARDRLEQRDRQRLRGRPRSSRDVEVSRHEREGLFLAELPRAQQTHRTSVGRVARQVVAAETLDGHDPTPAISMPRRRAIGSTPSTDRGLAVGAAKRVPRAARRGTRSAGRGIADRLAS